MRVETSVRGGRSLRSTFLSREDGSLRDASRERDLDAKGSVGGTRIEEPIELIHPRDGSGDSHRVEGERRWKRGQNERAQRGIHDRGREISRLVACG